MSFNLTSDGSPTPRKAISRFAVPNDLRLDTSPEVLGFGPVGTRTRHHPSQYVWPGSALLTSNMQGAKRPLGSSTLGNQMMPHQPNIDAYKVSPSSHPERLAWSFFFACCCQTLTLTILEDQDRARPS
jgi:hypothetical protein